ncbi:MAG: tetratricopeptide repeat protein [Planctomycetota bacterium]|nr:MAG: tetratricopeptide repeat protein [Planctomycetota bacterium]
MATAPDAFQAAFAHHQAGRLREAETLYRQVLQGQPGHVDALHLLGVLAHQCGQNETAEKLIARAIGLAGNRALFHANLGAVLKAQGKLAAAETSLRRALELDANQPDAHNNLGNVLLARGLTDEAAEAYRRAIGLRESFAEPHNNLATILHGRGQLDEAARHFRRAIELKPNYVDAHNNLGTTLKEQGQLAEAETAYRQALGLAPQNSVTHVNLGTVHQARGRLDEAAAAYREALALDSRSAVALNNLGTVFKEQGKLDEAIERFEQAIAADPQLAEAHCNLGGARQAQQDYAAASECYRRALALDPRHVSALVNLGKLHHHAGRVDEALEHFNRAIAADDKMPAAYLGRADTYKLLTRTAEAISDYQTALRLQPHYPEAYNNLAVLYTDLGQPEQAVECCQQGLAQQDDLAALHANLATALAWQGRRDEAVVESRRAVELRPESAAEFSNLLYGLNFVPGYDPQALFEEHLEWARRHAEPLTAVAAPHANDPTPTRRLRLGYVSPYFREHAVNFFSEPLITSHDHDQFAVFCYSDVRVPDAATRRIEQSADHWRPVRYQSDEQLAEQIRRDRIDILVDLTGHIAGNRLLAFARKPAPVQVTYIGYQNTTGMSAMDYRLTDERADPPGRTEHLHTEQLVRLPKSYFCYRPAEDAAEITPLPAAESGRVTFGSFNNYSKVTPQVIEAWIEILSRVTDSRLLVLANRGGYAEETFHRRAAERGIDPGRIELFDRQPRAGYYKLLARADVALDPFPFNGHTTTCDCIWHGVPVVMLEGQVYASRFGGSVLANVGLEELIASDVEQYIDLAVAWAGDLERLARERAELRQRMAESPLLDFEGFTREVEQAYRQMWVTWCRERSRWEG